MRESPLNRFVDGNLAGRNARESKILLNGSVEGELIDQDVRVLLSDGSVDDDLVGQDVRE